MACAQLATKPANARARTPAPSRARPAHPAAQGPVLQRVPSCPCGGGCQRCTSIQRKPASPSGDESLDADAAVDATATGGAPLSQDLRAFFEPRFGQDFSRVRVHTDAAGADAARSVQARAYTYGPHIVFGAGEYAPATAQGKHLLAHELAHVVQQGAGAGTPGRAASAPRIDRQTPAPVAEDPFAGTFLDTPVNPPIGKLAALTADELMERLVVAVRAFEGSPGGAPVNTPKGAGSTLGPGYKTYAGLQIIDKEGNQVLSAIGRYVGGGKEHAEVNAVKSLLGTLRNLQKSVAGMRLMVVVDQTVCENCTGALDAFAQEAGIEQMEVFLTSRDNVTPKTAARTGPKVGVKAKLSFTKTFPRTPPAGPAPGTPEAPVEKPPATVAEEPPAASGKSAAVGEQAPGAAGSGPIKAPTQTTAPVQTEINVVNTVEVPGGQTVTELEITFGKGLELANQGAPEVSGLPAKMGIRITQAADGALVAAESTTGQPAALAEAMAQQILRAGPGGSAAVKPGGAAAGPAAAAAEGATEGAAAGPSRALTVVSKGLKWGGTAVFVVITGYQLITAKPEQRARVAVKAAGGLGGGIVGSYLICNLLLDVETAGWGILLCGIAAGGAGGYAGSELAGEMYDDATLTDLDRALQELAAQPLNVRRLFYSLVVDAGSAGFPMSPEFVKRFIGVVPGNLTDAELITLAGKLHGTAWSSLSRDADAAISAIRQALYSLPGRGLLNVGPAGVVTPDILKLPSGFSFGPEGAGKITILPGPGGTPLGIPEPFGPSNNVLPLLQIDLESPKKKKK